MDSSIKVTFFLLFVIFSKITLALDLDLTSCNGFDYRNLEFSFYLHAVRIAPNSSVRVDETPISGRARQFPPYSFGYTTSYSRKLTSGPEYSSPEIGRMEGYSSFPNTGEEFLQGDFNFTSPFSGYFTIQGYADFNQSTSKLIVNGGVGDFAYAIGQVILTTFLEYAAGNNFVFLCKASLKILKLC